jgi:succinate dehydrogenase/fumarate reductase flavoprotein subunit
VAAELIARSALARTESRGSHFRRDHPAPGDALYSVRVRAEAGVPRVSTAPVRLDRYRPEDAPAALTVEVGD